jgi:hypothetical protein
MFRAIGPSAGEATARTAADVAEQARALAAEALKQDAATAATDTELAALSQSGTLSARPAASSVIAGTFYFATDDNGGTVYRSDGSSWTKIAASVAQSGGAELGYAAITASVTNTGGTAAADVSGLSITVTVGTRPIIVKFRGAGLSNSAAHGGSFVTINEGGTVLGQGNASDPIATVVDQANAEARLTPSAGSHTYKVRIGSVFSGNTTVIAAPTFPAYIQAIEC